MSSRGTRNGDRSGPVPFSFQVIDDRRRVGARVVLGYVADRAEIAGERRV